MNAFESIGHSLAGSILRDCEFVECSFLFSKQILNGLEFVSVGRFSLEVKFCDWPLELSIEGCQGRAWLGLQ